MNAFALGLSLAFLAVPAHAGLHDTRLGQLAAALDPGEYGAMPDNPSFAALPMNYSLLYWADSGAWDPTRQRLSIVAGPGTCCANPALYKRLVYDPASDAWSLEDTPFAGAHHAYDGNALDPVTGVHYFHLQAGPVHRFDGTAWTALPALPWSPTSPVSGASLTWFPASFGGAGALLYVAPAGRVAIFRNGAWTKLTVPNWGSVKMASEYNPVQRAVWVVAGTQSYRLTPDLQLTRLADAPVTLGAGNALHSTDPNSGRHVVIKIKEGNDQTIRQWWEFDLAADAWTRKPEYDGIHPVRADRRSAFHVPIPELGVIAFVTHYHTERRLWLFKYTAVPDAPPDDPPPPPPDPECIPSQYDTEPPLAFCPAVLDTGCGGDSSKCARGLQPRTRVAHTPTSP
jgi:hypothetical protein